MKITITIDTSNAAFHSHPAGYQVSRCLQQMTWDTALESLGEDQLPVRLGGHRLRDVNGNTVGSVTVEES